MKPQKYSSADTSINTVNLVYKSFKFPEGSLILDYGGGKYDSNVNYMKKLGVDVLVFDPFNRTKAHNQKVLDYVSKYKPDFIINSNVLNVIAEDDIVLDVIKTIKKLSGSKTTVIFAIYEGNKTGVGKVTTKGYQRNLKTAAYVPIISSVFPNVKRKSTFIIASKSL